MSAQEILDKIGGQEEVRAYLRGVEAGSETDRAAQRAMLAAIRSTRAAGIYDVMAEKEPEMYAQACLLKCRMWTDAEDGVAEKILAQYQDTMLALRYHEDNVRTDA